MYIMDHGTSTFHKTSSFLQVDTLGEGLHLKFSEIAVSLIQTLGRKLLTQISSLCAEYGLKI